MKLSRLSSTPLFTALAGSALLLLAGCAGMPGSSSPAATAQLQARSGSSTSGTVRFVQHGDHVMVHAEVAGLTPGQQHGFHIHDKGDCSAPDAMSAGGHFNPTGQPHGPQGTSHHGGDMPSLVADASGKAVADFHLMGVTVADGPTSIVGRAVVVHKDPDDYKTQPTGNSGARIACGLVVTS